MPAFQPFDVQDNHAEVDEGGHGSESEDDTKKSFDFMGELQKLKEPGGSGRHSFIEQVKNAFKTPARIELGFGFGIEEGMLAPPLPALRQNLRIAPSVEDIPQNFSNSGDTLSMLGSDEAGNRDSDMSQGQEQGINFKIRELEDESRVPCARTPGIDAAQAFGRLSEQELQVRWHVIPAELHERLRLEAAHAVRRHPAHLALPVALTGAHDGR